MKQDEIQLQHVLCDLKAKEFLNISRYICPKLNIQFFTARISDNTLLKVFIPVGHDAFLSQQWMCNVFKDLTIPGEVADYDDGFLLAIVGCTLNIVYHQVYPGVQPVARF